MWSALRQNLLPTHRCILERKEVLKHRHLINWPPLLSPGYNFTHFSPRRRKLVSSHTNCWVTPMLSPVHGDLIQPKALQRCKMKCNWMQISEESAIFALFCWNFTAHCVHIWMHVGHFMAADGHKTLTWDSVVERDWKIKKIFFCVQRYGSYFIFLLHHEPTLTETFTPLSLSSSPSLPSPSVPLCLSLPQPRPLSFQLCLTQVA